MTPRRHSGRSVHNLVVTKIHHPAADRDWWRQDAGTHYRELAIWLRELAQKCRLPNPQRELLNFARQYEIRADQLERRKP